MEAVIDAIPDLMFEVDIEGRIYNYHARTDDLLAAPAEMFWEKNCRNIALKIFVCNEKPHLRYSL
jgi:hypothetical protein